MPDRSPVHPRLLLPPALTGLWANSPPIQTGFPLVNPPPVQTGFPWVNPPPVQAGFTVPPEPPPEMLPQEFPL